MGRHEDVIAVYREQSTRKLCDRQEQKLAENVYVSLFRGLSLKEYVMARNAYCQDHHFQPCSSCRPMLSLAVRVSEQGYCMLSEGFRFAFPDQKYKTDIAIDRLLQMPLAAIRVGTPESGKGAWFLIEFVQGVDYINVARFSQVLFKADTQSPTIGLDKNAVKSLLGLASSDRERELIRYSVMKSSGMTPTRARRDFGFERMKERIEHVEECIEVARRTQEDIDRLSQVQDQSLLIAMGLKEMPLDSDTESESNDETVLHSSLPAENLPAFDVLMAKLQDGKYNWFVLADVLQELDY